MFWRKQAAITPQKSCPFHAGGTRDQAALGLIAL